MVTTRRPPAPAGGKRARQRQGGGGARLLLRGVGVPLLVGLLLAPADRAAVRLLAGVGLALGVVGIAAVNVAVQGAVGKPLGIRLLAVRVAGWAFEPAGPRQPEGQRGARRLRRLARSTGARGSFALTWVAPGLLDRVGATRFRRRHLLLMAAPPVAELLLAVGLAALGQGLSGTPRFVVAVLALFAGVYALLCLLPLTRGGSPSPGRWLWWWWLRPQQAFGRLAILTLTLAADGSSRQRPRDWPRRWVQVAAEVAAAGARARRAVQAATAETCGHLAYLAALDRGDVAVAGACLEAATAASARLPQRTRATMAAEAAFYHARWTGQPDKARELLAGIEGVGMLEELDRLRARAALLLADGDHQAAIDACDQWLAGQARQEARLPGVDVALRDWVERIREAASRAQAGGDRGV
jgi:hypothetical protein